MGQYKSSLIKPKVVHGSKEKQNIYSPIPISLATSWEADWEANVVTMNVLPPPFVLAFTAK